MMIILAIGLTWRNRKIWTFGSDGDFYSERENLSGDGSRFSLGLGGRTYRVA